MPMALSVLGDAEIAALQLGDAPSEVLRSLSRLSVPVSVVKHDVIKTMAEGVSAGLLQKLPGCICKNILVTDRSKKHFLLVATMEQKLDFKALPKVIECMDRVPSMEKDAAALLGVDAGCLSPLALIRDTGKRVTVVLDQDVASSELLHMHPMCHDATVTLRSEDLLRYLESLSTSVVTCRLSGLSDGEHESGLIAASTAAAAHECNGEADKAVSEQVVTPWEVEAGSEGIDYDKLMRDFGAERIDEALIARMVKLMRSAPHRFLRRQLFYTHRDFGKLLDEYERGVPFYLYTGRGPSSESLHLWHLMPFLFTKWLQDVFNVPLVIQLTDDEKFFFKENLSLEETHRLAYENAKDIIACGFDPDLTFIFTDLDYIDAMYPVVCKIQKAVTFNQAKGAFGFDGSSNLGKIQFPAVEAAPAFPVTFPHIFKGRADVSCLITMAIDQDPFFRVTRDVAPRLGWRKPALLHSKFFPALQGPKTKMSGSSESPATIFMTDTPQQIHDKIHKYAYSGGRATLEEHRRLGADLAVDVPYRYLSYLLEDDERLADIGREYGSGRLLSGEVKDILVEELVRITAEHQQRKALVTDEIVRHFMDRNRKSLDFSEGDARRRSQ